VVTSELGIISEEGPDPWQVVELESLVAVEDAVSEHVVAAVERFWTADVGIIGIGEDDTVSPSLRHGPLRRVPSQCLRFNIRPLSIWKTPTTATKGSPINSPTHGGRKMRVLQQFCVSWLLPQIVLYG